MAKRSRVRRVLGVGVLAGAAYALWRAIEANRPEGDTDWEPQPFPFPPQPRYEPEPERPSPAPATTAPAPGTPAAAPRVDAIDGACPASHPVKVARGSKVFHVPDGQLYERTTAEHCYRDAPAAEADGHRQSKR